MLINTGCGSLGIVANLLTVVLYAKFAQRSPTNYVVSVFAWGGVVHGAAIFMSTFSDYQSSGAVMCPLISTLMSSLIVFEFFMLSIIALVRYRLVCQPQKTQWAVCHVTVAIVISTFVSIVTCIPVFLSRFQQNEPEVNMTMPIMSNVSDLLLYCPITIGTSMNFLISAIGFVLSIFFAGLFVFCYGNILYSVIRHNKTMISASNVTCPSLLAQTQRRKQQERKIVFFLVAMTLFSCVNLLPLVVIRIMQLAPSVWVDLGLRTNLVNVFVNPVYFLIISSEAKAGLGQLLSHIGTCCK